MALGGGRTAKLGARYEAYALANVIVEIILYGDSDGFIDVEPPPLTTQDDDGVECRHQLQAAAPVLRTQVKVGAPAAEWRGRGLMSELGVGLQKALEANEGYRLVTGATSGRLVQMSSGARRPLADFKTIVSKSQVADDVQVVRAGLCKPPASVDGDQTWNEARELLANIQPETADEATQRRLLLAQLPQAHQLISSGDSLEGLEARLLDAASRCEGARRRDDLITELSTAHRPNAAALPPTPAQARLAALTAALEAGREPPALARRAVLQDAITSAILLHGLSAGSEQHWESDSVTVHLSAYTKPTQAWFSVGDDGVVRLQAAITDPNVLGGHQRAVEVPDLTEAGLTEAATDLLGWIDQQLPYITSANRPHAS